MSDLEPSGARHNESPLVTVAMPVYNAGKYLRLAVLSIVRQTFTQWELLIIDDGSTDNALQSIADINDARIRILRDGQNKGLAARLNECIDLARGKYFARMDQDDVSYPERFARQLKLLHTDAALDVIATRAITIDEDNREVSLFPGAMTHEQICARPWRGFYFPHPTWMGNVCWFRRYRYMIPGPYFCEDQELLLRSYRQSKFATVDEVLFAYRIRKQNNWRKLFTTRKAVLGIQINHFLNSRQWGYLMLALWVVAGRMAGDVVKFSAQTLFQPQRTNLAASLSRQWGEVLESISDKPSVLASGTSSRAGLENAQ